jgi:hypothetical protein
MWNVIAKGIPVIIGATGTVPKSLKTKPEKHTGKHAIRELQNPDIMGTADVLRKVLM